MTFGKSIAGVLIAVAVTSTMALAQEKTAPASAAGAKAAVLKADNDRFAAMQKDDVAALEKILGDELHYTHTSAVVQTKAQFIDDIRTGKIKYLSVEPNDQNVDVFGNVAVVTGGAAVHIILNGADQSFKIRYTNVQVNRNGRWEMVAWEATRLPA